MSNRHMIVVWDADISGKINNFSEAAKKIWTLLRQESEPSTKMLAFAQEIENYNNIDSNLLKLLKKFANEIRASNTVACNLDLPEYGWKILLKAIVETAQKYQLIVFDEEIFLALLADGSFSPPSRNQLWQEIVEEIESGNNYPQSLIDFTANIKDRLAQMLSQNDWVLADEIIEQRYNESCLLYSKKVDFGKHQISIGCNGNYGVFKITVYLSIIDENAISICQKSGFNYSTTGILLNIPLLLLEDDDSYQITNNQSLNELLNVIQNTVIYWSNSALNIKGVDNFLNGDIDERVTKEMHYHLYMPYCLIAARLANNPNFEELALDLGVYGPDSGRTWGGRLGYSGVAVAWQKLVNYLREHIEPLSDWPKDFVLPPDTQENELQVLGSLSDQRLFPKTITQFDELFKIAVENLLIEGGFFIVSKSYSSDGFEAFYEKEFNNGRLFLAINCKKEINFILAINFRIIEKDMIAIAQKTGFKYSMQNGGGIFLHLNGVLKLKELICINSHQKLEELSILLQTSILKWSGAITNIKDIDALINGEMDEAIKNYVQSSVYAPYALIAARLANNPNFDKLAISLGTYGAGSGRAWGKFSHAEVAAAWPKLVKYLRDEVKPLI